MCSKELNLQVTLNDIQKRIASAVDQSADAPDNTGDDWNIRKEYINWAQDEWYQLYDWQALYKEYNTLTSASTGNLTVSLPSDFRRVAGFPRVAIDGVNNDEVPEIRPQETRQIDPSERYFYLMGNEADGYSAVFHINSSNDPMASGTSIFFSYYSSAGSLASPADVTSCPDANYIVHRAIAHLYEARGDARFASRQQEADKILQRLLEREVTYSEAQNKWDKIRTVEETKFGFRWGRN